MHLLNNLSGWSNFPPCRQSINSGAVKRNKAFISTFTPNYDKIKSTVICSRLSSLQAENQSFDFCFATLCDWFRKLTPISQPIRCKTKINHDLVARVFPRFKQFWFYDSQAKSVLRPKLTNSNKIVQHISGGGVMRSVQELWIRHLFASLLKIWVKSLIPSNSLDKQGRLRKATKEKKYFSLSIKNDFFFNCNLNIRISCSHVNQVKTCALLRRVCSIHRHNRI